MEKVHDIGFDQIKTFDYHQKAHLTPHDINRIESYSEKEKVLFESLNRLDNIKYVLKEALKKVPKTVKSMINNKYNTPKLNMALETPRIKLMEVMAWNYLTNHLNINTENEYTLSIGYIAMIKEILSSAYLTEIMEKNSDDEKDTKRKEMIAINMITHTLIRNNGEESGNKYSKNIFANTLKDLLTIDVIKNMDDAKKAKFGFSRDRGINPYEQLIDTGRRSSEMIGIIEKYRKIINYEKVYGTLVQSK